VKYLKQAYDTLSKSYVLFFNYRAAAETYDKISSINRFEEKDRRDAARNALVLYSNMADTAKMTAVRQRLMTLGPSAQEKAEADFIVADSDMKAWDPRGADDGPNRNARQRATNSMMQYYDANKNISAAAKYVVEAGYNVARMRQSADTNADEWRKKTITAFERYKATAGTKDGKNEAMGSREAGFAAECEYAMVDAEVKKSFDYETGHHRYAGSPVDVIKKFQADVVDAKKHHGAAVTRHDAYASPEWATAAISRQGSLYDSMRTGLTTRALRSSSSSTPRPGGHLEAFLENSDNPDDQDKADQIRQKVTEAWRSAARARAQRRRRGDDPLLRNQRRARQTVQRAQHGREPRQPAPGVFHRHSRRGQDVRLLGRRNPRSGLPRRALPADATGAASPSPQPLSPPPVGAL
jgi:hypothetical protein